MKDELVVRKQEVVESQKDLKSYAVMDDQKKQEVR
jgi:hypothetical protein